VPGASCRKGRYPRTVDQRSAKHVPWNLIRVHLCPSMISLLGVFAVRPGAAAAGKEMPAGRPAGIRVYKSPLRKASLPLPAILEDPVFGSAMRLSLSHQAASGLNWRRERGNKGVILVGWEGGIPAPDKSYISPSPAPQGLSPLKAVYATPSGRCTCTCRPVGEIYSPDCERTIFPSFADSETFEGLALRISSAIGFSTRRWMTRLSGRAPKSGS